MNITICGGGSLGHVCAAVLGSHPDVRISMLTGHPEAWQRRIACTDPAGKRFECTLHTVTANAAQALHEADWVFLCLPGFLIEKTLCQIREHLGHAAVGAIVGSTGFFFAAHRLLPQGTPLFAFQRTPFIARTKDYGASALLLGYKPEVHVAAECMPAVDDFRRTAERLFLTPTRLLGSFYEASLTNSNPILHTGRLFSMWGHYDGRTWERPILFYKEWTDEASQLLIDMDAEFMRLLDVLPMQGHRIPTLLSYYESTDAPSLTAKISSIAAFQTITAPMRPTPNGWVPDFASRYFTEDFPFGLRFIKELAAEHGVPTPTIDKVLAWGMSVAIV